MTVDEAIRVLNGLTVIAWYHGHSVNTPDRGAKAMHVMLDDRNRLAARVAELEAALDRAERLAAYVTEDRYPDEIEDAMGAADSLTWTGSGWAEHLAVVRAVTRAATTANAPPHATQGGGE